MAIDLNTKLTRFTGELAALAKAEAKAIETEVCGDVRDVLADFEASLAAEAERRVAAETAQIRSREEKRFVAAHLASRRKLLEYREACASEVMREVSGRVAVFPESPKYADRLGCLLLQAVCSLPGAGEMTVLLRKQDMHLADKLRESVPNANLSFAEGDFTLGGLMVLTADGLRRADLSFDSALSDMEGKFSELTGFDMEERNGR